MPLVCFTRVCLGVGFAPRTRSVVGLTIYSDNICSTRRRIRVSIRVHVANRLYLPSVILYPLSFGIIIYSVVGLFLFVIIVIVISSVIGSLS